MTVVRSIGYFFIILYLLLFLKIEPISSFFNKLPVSGGFEIFFTFVSLAFIYHSIVDIYRRLKKFFNKDYD